MLLLFLLALCLAACTHPAAPPKLQSALSQTEINIPTPLMEATSTTRPKASLIPSPERDIASPSATVSPTTAPTYDRVWAEDLRREGNLVKAMICFDPPNGMDWSIDQATLRFANGGAELDRVEFLPYAGKEEALKCSEAGFTVPQGADLSTTVLEVRSIRASPGEGEFCDRYLNQVQPTLTARQTGILIECTSVDQGWNLSVTAHPDTMTLEEAEQAVYDFYTVSGPWRFTFVNPPIFVLDPQTYEVKASASNFRRQGDFFEIEVCIQMDHNDWDAWQVQEAILGYAGREDKYFGTSAQLRRVSQVGGSNGKYCGVLAGIPELGSIPSAAQGEDFSLRVSSIAPVVDYSNRCTTYLEQVQKRLDESNFGIQLQCGKTLEGIYALQAQSTQNPIPLSQTALERVLANEELFLGVKGPWDLILR